MSVIAKYVVVRNGVELDKTFSNKKEAEAYDMMLDAAEELAGMIKEGDHGLNLDEKVIEDISLVLAKNATSVIQILKIVKPVKAAPAGKRNKATRNESTQDQNNGIQTKANSQAA
ncbi:MAG: YebG family protein [Desulfatitalea sp.]|nr:YebG family protein [Desulfatitalea sp.]NNJ99446.1 YebG family protein [Desulfatitalea sp.]